MPGRWATLRGPPDGRGTGDVGQPKGMRGGQKVASSMRRGRWLSLVSVAGEEALWLVPLPLFGFGEEVDHALLPGHQSAEKRKAMLDELAMETL